MGAWRRVGRGWLLAACFLVACFAHASPSAPEVWVVNEGSEDVSVIGSETDTVVATIPLMLPGPIDSPAPRSVAFSTIRDHVGEFAFVTQGRYVRVLRVATREILNTVDIASLTGVPSLLLEGSASARLQDFLTVTGRVPRAYLHAGAHMETLSGDLEPLFVVLDQEALAGLDATRPVLVASGRLDPPLPAAPEGKAVDVAVLTHVHGPQHQRAWYTVLAPGDAVSPEKLRAHLVTTTENLGAPWTLSGFREQRAPMSGQPVEALRAGAPFTGELPVWPHRAAGDLAHLGECGTCAVGGEPVDVAVAGAGANSYTLVIADPGMDRLVKLDPLTCDQVAYPVADGPVAVVFLGRVDWRKAYAANHDGDAVTVLRPDDTVATIPLAPPSVSCTRCPRALAVEETPGTEADVAGLLVCHDPSTGETCLSWNPMGSNYCYSVRCQCRNSNLSNCPPGCMPGDALPPGPPGSIQCKVNPVNPWIILGTTLGTSFTHSTGSSLQPQANYGVDATQGGSCNTTPPCTCP